MRVISVLLILLIVTHFQTSAQTTFNAKEYDGIIVGDVVSGRDMGATNGKLINSYILGQQVKVVGESHWKDIIEGDDTGACEEYGYSWLEVENLKKERAWMYGKYLFQKNQPFQNEMIGKSIRYKDKDWYFGLANSLSYPSSDDGGPTGCDELTLPFLYRENEEKVYLIVIEEDFGIGSADIRSMFDGNLLMLASGEGGSSSVNSIEVVNGELIALLIDNIHQDGLNQSTVTIKLDGDRFVVTKVVSTDY